MPTERYDNLYDKQVTTSIQSLFELTSRVDERVNNMTETTRRFETTFQSMTENQQKLIQRVTSLEAKNGHDIKKSLEELNERLRRLESQVLAIEFIAKGTQSKWDKLIDKIVEYGMRIFVAIAAALLAYKLSIGN